MVLELFGNMLTNDNIVSRSHGVFPGVLPDKKSEIYGR